MAIWLQAMLVGTGATLVMDVWSWWQRNVLRIPTLNYAFVGRWFIFIYRGQLVHRPIMVTPSVRGEASIGWFLHYLSGIIFALVHVMIFGDMWLSEPTLIPALVTGVVTLVFLFCLIQPCLGFGVAASKTPSPWKARGLSLLTHSVYGVGLFTTALSLKYLL
jgi:uncharacterized membrane protein YeaQ/YmgE (transglycosylase-associated protein family)